MEMETVKWKWIDVWQLWLSKLGKFYSVAIKTGAALIKAQNSITLWTYIFSFIYDMDFFSIHSNIDRKVGLAKYARKPFWWLLYLTSEKHTPWIQTNHNC